MKAKRSVWIIVALIPLIVVGAFNWPRGENARLQSRTRKQWKDRAIADLTRRFSDPRALTNEVTALRAESARGDDGWWVGTNVLLMGDGKYLVYSDINAKEDGRIHDLFIACSSDGRWYYSTYHFCVSMVSIRVDEQPASVDQFAQTYFVRDFDGTSETCLKKTWPVKR